MPPKTYLVGEAYILAEIRRIAGPRATRRHARNILARKGFPRPYYTPTQERELHLTHAIHLYERKRVDDFIARRCMDYLLELRAKLASQE